MSVASTDAVTVRHLKNASEEEIIHVVTILQAAFKDEPFLKLPLGGDMSFVPIRFNANVRAATAQGEIHIAAVGSEPEDIIGAGLWDEQRTADNFFLIIPDELRSWWTQEYLPATKKFSEDSLGAEFPLKNWYLHMFGVVPEHHRKGVGKAMMSFAEQLAREDGASICLDTMTVTSANIYKHMGFELKGETKVTSWVGEYPLFVLTKTP